MCKGLRFLGGMALVMMLNIQSAYAASPLFSEMPQQSGEASDESGFKQTLANVFAPYLKGTAVIRQKMYEHLLQSEEFIRVESLIEYIWEQRAENS